MPLFVAGLLFAACAHAAPEQRAEVIGALSDELAKRYIFPDKVPAAMEAIRAHEKAGAYDAVSDDALAALLTTHLQQAMGDLHLQVGYRALPIPVGALGEPRTAAAPGPANLKPKFAAPDCYPGNIRYHAAGETECLTGDIGYVKVYGFMHDAGDAIDAAMSRLADSKALIIDVRQNNGGSPAMVAHLSSYLFDARTHLSDIYWRGPNRTQEFWTSNVVAGRRFGQQKPVYVLTSGGTFSAGEELAYDLQALGRAILVGATTKGGAHPGGPVRLTAHFGAVIPYGRSINPVTGGNWEGTGVVPDVAVPEDNALIVAQSMALTAMLKGEPRARRRSQLRAQLTKLARQNDE